ncbi:hypothetical protein K439DRAFT_1630462 [Ramaria rubella]|nr:hypothetical protein K439DRAFT_1630462 [Ramaria rubella]
MTQGFVPPFGTRTAHLRGKTLQLRAPYSTPSEFVLRRALGSGEESSTTSSSSALSFGTLFPTHNSSSNEGERHGISQTVLEWVFAVIALGLLTILVIWRCVCMKRRNHPSPASYALPFSRGHGRLPVSYSRSWPQPLQQPQLAHIRSSEFFVGSFDSRAHSLVLSPSFLHTGLMPLVDGQGVQINSPGTDEGRTRTRRVRGLDVDEGGRRGGGTGSENEDNGPGDELPAYEIRKGPPGYHTVASGNVSSPDIVAVGLPARTSEQDVTRETLDAHSQNGREASGCEPRSSSPPQWNPSLNH